MRESIAVVITCFNLERYIDEAIRSVLSQDIGLDSIDEIVVVDDCSTHRSAAIIQSHPDVRYLRTERNSGVLLATMVGIAATRSEQIYFLDGDDVWEPSKLRLAMQAFQGGIGLVTHDLSYIDAKSSPVALTSRVSVAMNAVSQDRWGGEVIRGILMHEDFVWLGSAYAIRRSKSDLAGFCRFVDSLPDARNTYQDWPLAFWVASRPGVRAEYVPERLFRYRLHGANHSGDATSADKAMRNFLRAFNTIEAINLIAKDSSTPAEVNERISRRLAYAQYLVDLYAGRRLRAWRGLLKSVGYVHSANIGIARELARCCGVTLLGVRGFTKMVSRLRHGRYAGTPA